MKDILSDIVAHKREELKQQRALLSEDELRRHVATLPIGGRSMKQSLSGSATGIIAEFKRRSPSKGWIHREARVEDVTPLYQAGGASALSILTDEAYFGGTLDDIRTARRLVDLPILRKDFIVDGYQLLQARQVGADAVLLIAACLSREDCFRLTREAHALNLEVLLEVHAPEEIDYADCLPDMLGVNNRNLGSFVTDVNNSFRLSEALQRKVKALQLSPEQTPLLVSESGISQPGVVISLRQAGFRGFLMGEAFMKHAEPGKALSDFVRQLGSNA